MIEIKITEKSPLDALASLTAFGMYCQSISIVKDAAKCILEQDARKEAHDLNADTFPDTSASVSTSVPAQTAAPTPQQQAAPAAPMPVSAPPVMAPTPANTPTPPPAPVPTAAPVAAPAAYTLEQLQHAAGELVRTNKREALLALLGQFNISALTQLPKEQYGAFATALRGIGAMI